MIEPQELLDHLVAYRADRKDEVHDCWNTDDEAGALAEMELVIALNHTITCLADTYSLDLPKEEA